MTVANDDVSWTRIELDLSCVEYSWGDSPVSSVVRFWLQGTSEIRIIAGAENRQALEDLVNYSGIPGFSVTSVDP